MTPAPFKVLLAPACLPQIPLQILAKCLLIQQRLQCEPQAGPPGELLPRIQDQQRSFYLSGTATCNSQPLTSIHRQSERSLLELKPSLPHPIHRENCTKTVPIEASTDVLFI